MFAALVGRLRALLGRRSVEQRLDEEVRFHLDLETEKNIALGMDREAARRQALLDFGGVEPMKEAQRDARGVRPLEELLADVRYALRLLRRNPVLTGAAIVTLALGVGANTAIFSAVNAVVLRPLPFADPGRLVMLHEENPELGWHRNSSAPANVLDWREQVAAFEDVAAYESFQRNQTLTGQGEPRVLTAVGVTGNFFSLLGINAQLGRTFEDRETWQTGANTALISDRLWREQFSAAPDLIGRSIMLEGQPVQVIGVLPPGFRFPDEHVDIWIPTAWPAANRAQVFFRRAHWLWAIGRLRPGVSLEAADNQLQTVVRRLQQQYPVTNRVMGAAMTPLQTFLIGDVRQPLLVLLGAVALLLLIACANVGNLLLVQAAGREREAALRLTLGAGRGRLMRQAMTESLVLSLVGGVCGLALGWWGTRALSALQPAGMLPVASVNMDWRVLGYVLLITTASGLLFGLAPTAWSARRAPAEVLKEGGLRGGASSRMRRWADALAAGEIAVALLLTLGAGLLVHSFWRLQRVNPGFEADGVLTASLTLPSSRYDAARGVAFYDALFERLGALPGVSGVAGAAGVPLTGVLWTSDFAVAGRASDAFGTNVAHREVTPGYFGLMRVPLLAGRTFTAADGAGSEPVVIINEALARKYFAGADPIGQRLTFDRTPDSTSVWRTIVGVVGSEHQATLATEPQIEIFAPVAQHYRRAPMVLTLRTSGDPLQLVPAVRQAINALDPELAATGFRTMTSIQSASLAAQRFIMSLLLVFAVTGLLLAVVGVYGVMAQATRRRYREMGIRIALGAQPRAVQWLVVRHGLRLVGAGLVLGLAGALAATRSMRALLFDVSPMDPLTFTTVPAALALTAMLASWLPARRASRASPAATLREE